MAGRGPAPKPDAVRRRAGKPATVIESGTSTPAPPLPPGDWSRETRDWYSTWCRSPQAQRFTPTDWQRLTMLAHVVDQFYAEPSVKLLAEVRINESLLGATEADRARLRWEIKPDATPTTSRTPVIRLQVT